MSNNPDRTPKPRAHPRQPAEKRSFKPIPCTHTHLVDCADLRHHLGKTAFDLWVLLLKRSAPHHTAPGCRVATFDRIEVGKAIGASPHALRRAFPKLDAFHLLQYRYDARTRLTSAFISGYLVDSRPFDYGSYKAPAKANVPFRAHELMTIHVYGRAVLETVSIMDIHVLAEYRLKIKRGAGERPRSLTQPLLGKARRARREALVLARNAKEYLRVQRPRLSVIEQYKLTELEAKKRNDSNG